jgi:predicted phage gp36 major capsid-like protein
MKDRNVCWVLSDEDRERYRNANPELDAKLKEKEKKAEDDAVEKITDEDIERMERLIALKKKKQAEQEKK